MFIKMNKHKLHLLIFSAIFETLLLILVIYLVFFQDISQKSPATDELSKCNALKFSGEGAINLLFFATQEQAKEYSDFLFQTQPYDNYHNRFNVYYNDNYIPECDIYKGIAILCKSREMRKEALLCQYDYIIVLVDNIESAIRSSTYADTLSLNLAHPMPVLPHELAHAISNLADEYVPAGALPAGQKNCVLSCSDFNGLDEGCFDGCTDNKHIRSIDKGVMSTLASNDYGRYNEFLIGQSIIDQSATNTDLIITGRQIHLKPDGKCVIVTIVQGGATAREIVACKQSEQKKPINPGLLYTDAPVEEIQIGQPEIVGGVIPVTPEEIGLDLVIPIEKEFPTAKFEIVTERNTVETVEVDITKVPEQPTFSGTPETPETLPKKIQKAFQEKLESFFSPDQDIDASDYLITADIIRELSDEKTFSRMTLLISLLIIVFATIALLRKNTRKKS